MIREVVHGQQGRRAADDRVVPELAVTDQQHRSGMPVVEMEDVDRRILGAEDLEGRTPQQPEPPGIVREVAVGIAVIAGAIEGRWVIHQAKPVSAWACQRYSGLPQRWPVALK